MTTLSHEYDPAKAREYYLRTRKLKGRKKGAAPTSVKRMPAGKQTATQLAVRKATQQRKSKAAKVKALNARLDKLRKVLADLVAQSKKLSNPKDQPKAKTGAAGGAKGKPRTAAEKRKAKEYYEENKKLKDNDELKVVQEKIERVKKQIEAARAVLEAAQKEKPKQTAAKSR